MIKRKIFDPIQQWLERGKIVLVLGPRQSGKTTLLKMIRESHVGNSLVFNCDETESRTLLSKQNSALLRTVLGYDKLVLVDEAQRLENAGLTLKLIHDTMPDIKLIATGSSAFELTDKLNEPLTGRKIEFSLLPFAFEELVEHTDLLSEIKQLQNRLLFGSYPEIALNPGLEVPTLQNLCGSYLYKDVFSIYDIRRPELVEKLVQALAIQLACEVSFHELAQLLDTDSATIERYIGILERAFIVFRLPNFNRNQRNEIKRSRKIYFIDNGIRNAVLSDFRPLELRDDIGKLWENYVVSEFLKSKANHSLYHRAYFWRNRNGAEVDYLELADNYLKAFEIKWNPRKAGNFRAFLSAYPDAETQTISPENYFQHIAKK
ncbi:MAG: ATP-binding protein [Candidatus Cloacimonadaceae bacterium]|jgi:predicted AAA+ superfamily ATPase|nr:ATP-binding protein [Candidatus Cloacimonadota bacterium]MDY0318842.1 ATP-binding protein [Candidatus Cloacimonadaceae bacterium]